MPSRTRLNDLMRPISCLKMEDPQPSHQSPIALLWEPSHPVQLIDFSGYIKGGPREGDLGRVFPHILSSVATLPLPSFASCAFHQFIS